MTDYKKYTFVQFNLQDLETLQSQFPQQFLLSAKHLAQQNNIPPKIFAICATNTQELLAFLPLWLEGEKAISPKKATFGGFWAKQALAFELLKGFLEWTENILLHKGVKEIHLKNAPQILQNLPTWEWLLWHNGYQQKTIECNYHLDLSQNIFDKLHKTAQRKVLKCEQEGFKFSLWQNPDLAVVYQFLKEARHRKDFPLTISWEGFEEMFAQFPQDYYIFVLKHAQNITALTVVVRFGEAVLYNFYPADNPQFLKYSPNIALIHQVALWAKNEGYSILDLGIATQDGQPNEGLMRFKEQLGGQASLKISFVKHLTLF